MLARMVLIGKTTTVLCVPWKSMVWPCSPRTHATSQTHADRHLQFQSLAYSLCAGIGN